MKPPKDCNLYLKKAAEDEALLQAIQTNFGISDSIFGFHAHLVLFDRASDCAQLPQLARLTLRS